MILDAGVLRGYPKERAELYGKPHLGAHYTHGKAYEALSPRCCVCGRRAGSVHHVAHRSWGEIFRLVTPCGTWDLRSPLFCLCGSGNASGCHRKAHDGRLHFRWVGGDDGHWERKLTARPCRYQEALADESGWGRLL